jgi:hypothetical protein
MCVIKHWEVEVATGNETSKSKRHSKLDLHIYRALDWLFDFILFTDKSFAGHWIKLMKISYEILFISCFYILIDLLMIYFYKFFKIIYKNGNVYGTLKFIKCE